MTTICVFGQMRCEKLGISGDGKAGQRDKNNLDVPDRRRKVRGNKIQFGFAPPGNPGHFNFSGIEHLLHG